MDPVRDFFSAGFFMPHGHCYLWRPEMVWLQVVANAVIGLSYVVISSTLYYVLRRIKDIPFHWMYLAFGVFIITCGMTHLLDVWTIWQPVYWLDGGVRSLTALASAGTAVMLIPLVPKAIALSQSAQLAHERGLKLEAANAQLARLLDQSRELELRKGHFFAATSHELRTPLALILGPIDKVLHEAQLTPPQRQDLQTAAQNGRLLLKHVNDILDISKLEAGKMTAACRPVDLSHLVRLTAAHFSSLASERDIRFAVQVPPAPLVVPLDEDKIEQVLMNLLSNAFKFTPTGGQIRCALEADPGARAVRLCIDDSGPGIPDDQREVVFERFRQLEEGSTRRFGGTGLGLAIAREFVLLHAGRIAVETAESGGARFVVELPAQAPQGALSEAAQPKDSQRLVVQATIEALRGAPPSGQASIVPPERSERPLVLVVEDNSEMNRFVREVLEATCDVAAAYDGAEGLRLAQQLRPDLMISDVMMPRLAGDDLVVAVRADPTLDAMQIMLLSARSDEGLRVQLLAQGAQDYLLKPFVPAELLARAENLLQMKRAREVLQGEVQSKERDLATLASEVAQRQQELRAALVLAKAAREQAEQASQIKTQFLNLVTHELRTPLTGLKLQLDRLARDQQALSPRHRTVVDRMQQSSGRLADLIESVLEHARLDGGQLRIGSEDVAVPQVARAVEDELRSLAESKGLQLSVSAAADLPRLRTDARLLRLVLSNLIGNAVKFTEQGIVEVRCTYEEGSHIIAVRDTGPGIAPAAMGTIFEPFTHIEPLSQKHTPGVGLGLALVRQMVRALRGDITLTSQREQGSVFTVRLPSSPQEGTEESSAS